VIRDPERGEVKVWDLTDDQAFRARPAHFGLLRGLALSPDGRRLASAGLDGPIRVWDADTFGRLPGRMGIIGSANTVAFSPDGTLLASRRTISLLNPKPVLMVWNAATGEPVHTLCPLDIALRAVAFSPDGRLLAADTGGNVFGEGPGDIAVWDLATGQKVVTLRGRSLAFSPDGRDVLTLKGHTADVLAVAFDRDGHRIVSGGRDRSVRLWDAATGAPLGDLRGHTASVTGLAFHPDGRRLAAASMDSMRGGKGEGILWDPATGRAVLSLPGNYAVAFSADGARLAAAYADMQMASEVRLFDTRPPR
jgi:WD40 repeat protein